MKPLPSASHRLTVSNHAVFAYIGLQTAHLPPGDRWSSTPPQDHPPTHPLAPPSCRSGPTHRCERGAVRLQQRVADTATRICQPPWITSSHRPNAPRAPRRGLERCHRHVASACPVHQWVADASGAHIQE